MGLDSTFASLRGCLSLETSSVPSIEPARSCICVLTFREGRWSETGRKEEGVEIGSLSLLLPVDFTSSFSFFFALSTRLPHLTFFASRLTEAAKEVSREFALPSLNDHGERRWSKGRRERGLRAARISQPRSIHASSRVDSRDRTCISEKKKMSKEQEEVALYR